MFVFCVNWCRLGHIYKIGSVLCCWVSLFICVCILVHLLLLFMQCTCLDLITTLAVVYRVGHSDVIGIIKLEFCGVMV